MYLKKVTGTDFRLFEHFELEPGPGLNFVLGENAAGKTSLLEAIYTLGRGRGYRGSPEELLRRGAQSWLVHGDTAIGPATQSIGVSWSSEGLKLRVDRADARLHEMARQFPVQALQPDSHRLLEDGPAYRRRYLDWGVFHVEQPFFDAWRRYQRALRQRNQALRQNQSRAAVKAWNPELIGAGTEVHQHRQSHLSALRTDAEAQIERFMGEPGWTLELAPGWSHEQTLEQALEGHIDQDTRQGTTTVGPHRAELRLRHEGRTSRRHASRGQQKLLVAALLLCQARLVAQAIGRPPILLVDDLPAELGGQFQAALLEALAEYPGQVFASAIEVSEAMRSAAQSAPETKLFHVEHQTVSPSKTV